MIWEVAGGVIVAAAVCGLFATGVYYIIEQRKFWSPEMDGKRDYTKGGLTEAGGWFCVCVSIILAVAIITIVLI